MIKALCMAGNILVQAGDVVVKTEISGRCALVMFN
jgi:hypothetical protein